MMVDKVLQIITTEAEFEAKLWSVLEKHPVCVLPPDVAEFYKLKIKPVLSPREVALLYDIPVGTLANWRAQGKGPVFCQTEDNGKVTYRAADLEVYFEGIRKVTYA